MKTRALGILASGAVLATLFVVATVSPASADTARLTVYNTRSNRGPIEVTASSPCGEIVKAVAPAGSQPFDLDESCNWLLVAVDAAGRCLVNNAEPPNSVGTSTTPGPDDNKAQVIMTDSGAEPDALGFYNTGGNCVLEPVHIQLEKEVPEEDFHAALLSEFTYTVTPLNKVLDGHQAGDGPCTADAGPYSVSPASPVATEPLIREYIENNTIFDCYYAVSELIPVGWTQVDWASFCGEFEPDAPVPTIIILNGGQCDARFVNELDPIPLTVAKTFVGREYYTTIDRADFHMYTPGLCGAFPMDPFGGLLGSVGVFRTINASQLPQVVIALPTIIAAGPNGPCTYRIQENNAPDGCVALDPDGSNADGPYWEQTWVPGETTEMNFNIVNNCAEVPEPTPEPTVAPTTTPKKPGAPGAKKPSGGGTAAPKFTG
jgi:hypothetical protein